MAGLTQEQIQTIRACSKDEAAFRTLLEIISQQCLSPSSPHPAPESAYRQPLIMEDEKLFRAVFEFAPVGIALSKLQGENIYSNPTFQTMLGYSAQDLLALDYRHITHPDDLPLEQTLFAELVNRQRPIYQLEQRYIRKDASSFWVRVSVSLVHDPLGNALHVLTVAEDIDERKQAKEALRESELKLRRFIEQSVEGMVLTDEQGIITQWNRAQEQITGITQAEAIGQTAWDTQFRMMMPNQKTPAMYDRIKTLVQQFLRAGGLTSANKVLEAHVQRPDGATAIIQTINFAIQTEKGYIAASVCRDVTEMRQAEQGLHEKQIRLGLLNNISTGILSGMSVEQIIRHTLQQIHLCFPRWRVVYSTLDDRQVLSVLAAVEPPGMPSLTDLVINLSIAPKYLKALKASKSVAVTDVTQDERLRPLKAIFAAVNIAAVLDVPLQHGQKLVGLLCFEAPEPTSWREHDVTTLEEIAQYLAVVLEDARLHDERRRAEQALWESEERFRQIAENVREVLYSYRPNPPQFLYISPAFKSIWGRSTQEFYADFYAFQSSIYPADLEHVQKAVQKELETGEPLNIEYRLLHPQKGIRWIWARDFPVRDPQGQIYRMVGIAEDITHFKQAEQQARELALERERSRILSTFVQDASHEFRTPLSVINTSLYLLGRTLESDKQKERIQAIQNEVDSILKLVEALVVMAQLESVPELHLQAVTLDELVTMVVSVQQTRTTELAILMQLDTMTTSVKADPELLSQALTHIIENAVRYTPSGGTITVSLRRVDDWVEIAVQDTGVGIKEQDQPHIFETFYRGDKVHKTRGFGLGLPIARKIVRLHHGSIHFESRLGEGSTFTIRLPIGETG